MKSSVICLFLVACGSATPPPKTDEAPKPAETTQREAPMPVVQQELGSIDQRGVEQTFQNLGSALERCHTEGRDRLEVIAGDVRVFMRVGADGKSKYAFFEHSTLGERATEKCILGVLTGASWPKPIGGEAEVRHQFGWESGQERKPVDWTAEKVTNAIDADKDAKEALASCKTGGELKLTAYVVKDEREEDAEPHPSSDRASRRQSPMRAPTNKKQAPPPSKPKEKAEFGAFRSIGGATKDKVAAESIDCVIDAISKVKLPSPGSYPAKVSFKL